MGFVLLINFTFATGSTSIGCSWERFGIFKYRVLFNNQNWKEMVKIKRTKVISRFHFINIDICIFFGNKKNWKSITRKKSIFKITTKHIYFRWKFFLLLKKGFFSKWTVWLKCFWLIGLGVIKSSSLGVGFGIFCFFGSLVLPLVTLMFRISKWVQQKGKS